MTSLHKDYWYQRAIFALENQNKRQKCQKCQKDRMASGSVPFVPFGTGTNYEFEERAAIIEFDTNFSRFEAEKRARECLK